MQVAGNQQCGSLTQFLPLVQSHKFPLSNVSTPLEAATYHVGIVEGNASLARLLATGLSAESVRVHIHEDLEAALEQMGAECLNILILDLDIDGGDGLALVAKLRTIQPSLRILALSGRAGVDRAVKALNQGADDYLMKPFSLLELVARVGALRRRSGEEVPAPKPLVGKLVLHRDQCLVTCNDHSVELTPRECELLEFMMAHPGMTLSRATLSQRVWNMPEQANTNIVDVYVKYLRDKLTNAYHQKLIRTVRGVGYVFQHQS